MTTIVVHQLDCYQPSPSYHPAKKEVQPKIEIAPKVATSKLVNKLLHGCSAESLINDSREIKPVIEHLQMMIDSNMKASKINYQRLQRIDDVIADVRRRGDVLSIIESNNGGLRQTNELLAKTKNDLNDYEDQAKLNIKTLHVSMRNELNAIEKAMYSKQEKIRKEYSGPMPEELFKPSRHVEDLFKREEQLRELHRYSEAQRCYQDALALDQQEYENQQILWKEEGRKKIHETEAIFERKKKSIQEKYYEQIKSAELSDRKNELALKSKIAKISLRKDYLTKIIDVKRQQSLRNTK